MSYPDMRYYITFFSKRYKDFEKSINANQSKPKGSPKVHPDSSLIIFFAIMIVNFTLIQALTIDGLFLLIPITGAKATEKLAYPQTCINLGICFINR